MMIFTCTYCEKPITCSAVLHDEAHFLHMACKPLYIEREAKKVDLSKFKIDKDAIVKNWEDLEFLKGLKGHVKENIARLYESQASHLLNEDTNNIDTE